MQTTVVELDDELSERLSVLARYQGSTVAKLLEDFARRLADAAMPYGATSTREGIDLPAAGSPTNRVTLEDVQRAIEEMDLEYAMKQFALCGGTARADAGR